MFEVLTSTLVLVYALMGLVAVFAFAPTIRDLWFGDSSVN